MAETPRDQSLFVGGIPARHVRVFGQNDEPADVDSISGGLILIDTVHARIHAGQFFTVNHLNLALADNATIVFLIRTGSRVAHARPFAVVGGDAQFEIFEGPTVTVDGAAQTVVNKNRLSSNTAETLVFLTPTTTGDGTELDDHLIVGGVGPVQSIGSEGSFAHEWDLNVNTEYLLRLTNRAGAAQPAHLQFDFYES